MAGALHATGLVKTFGRVRAVDGIDLDIPEGGVLGLLGPNGAGKTTVVRLLTTLLRPDAGTAVVAGHDVVRDPDAVRLSIGLSGQFAAVDDRLTGRENLRMTGALYGLRSRAARRRADELLDRFGLTDAADRRSGTYSGGMRRRLDLACALVAQPPVLFLDEPSVGLDPTSRLLLWDAVEDLVREGTTVLLTTQYLEEADRLAHYLAVVDHGRVIARGTSHDLKAWAGGGRIELIVSWPEQLDAAAWLVARLVGRPPDVDRARSTVSAPADGGVRLLAQVVAALEHEGVEISDIGLRRPTLDEVFLALTGDGPRSDGRVVVGAGGPSEKEW
ncbi:ATP-binding cassette domain-containing protein [Streptomyces lusitanus]|uniref:ATP-binding cassette domain-containing protein n=1 Tax=Streptomyces lusitanus TaxID=68232 RepID=A0ABU3K2N1_9ACTN|nr:ATP-binding cassette domain-containing protein [Streptomyces lusitanus]